MMSAATCLCFRVYQEMSDATVPKGASPQVYQTVVRLTGMTQWCQDDLRGLRSRSLEAAYNRMRGGIDLKCACHAHANER